MNFDQLQQQWQNEEVSTPEISLEHQNKINNPLDKIRKNMKMEFWLTLISIVLILFWLLFSIENTKTKLYSSVLVISMILVTIFYFNIFRKTYRFLSNNTISTLDALKDLLFQLKLNEQYYISYYLAFVPFLVCEIIILADYLPGFKKLGETELIFMFVSIVFFGLIILYVFGKYWFNVYYGKHINKISDLIVEIGLDSNNLNFGSSFFKSKKQYQYLSNTESFFTQKLGRFGSIVNTIVWIIIALSILMTISYIVGFLIGYFGMYLKNI